MNRDDSLAFRLAKQGYDVWLGNNRGDLFSRQNTHINNAPSNRPFWDYSFYELGRYDVPAQISKVIELTGYPKISYIGHSQGTSQMFTALSFNYGDIQDKLDLFIACAPIIDLSGSPNTLMVQAA